MKHKPYADSCDRNKDHILEVIKPLLSHNQHLLEIGSGTGQHGVYFAEKMPQLIWQTSDRLENHEAINAWLNDSQLTNIKKPIALDVAYDPWPNQEFDSIFSANTAHIMAWHEVELMFQGVANKLTSQGLFLLYGPFNYNGEFSSESNKQFDLWLKQQAPHRGVRDFEALNNLAINGGMELLNDFSMPANNQILVWQKN